MQSHISCWELHIDNQSRISVPNSECGDELLRKYSQFKFGNTNAVNFFSSHLFRAIKTELRNADSALYKIFSEAGSKDEYVYFTSPGIRNVPSASNLLLNHTCFRLNQYLALQGLPTGIIRPQVRLASGRSNYAELSKLDRQSRAKSTKSLIPISEYASYPIHVLFFDDLIASGATVERASQSSLNAGARSFTSCSLFKASPKAADYPEFEHELNSYEITGVLNQHVSACLSTDNYVPVQRMLRLLLHPKNSKELLDFSESYIPNDVLNKICSFALSNDYLKIAAPNSEDLIYAESLNSLIRYLNQKIEN